MIKDMMFLPMYDFVLVKEIEEEVTTDGGLILSASEKESGRFAEVVRVGLGGLNKDGSRRPMAVTEGDIVTYSPNAPKRKIKSEGQTFLLLTELEIYGVYKHVK